MQAIFRARSLLLSLRGGSELVMAATEVAPASEVSRGQVRRGYGASVTLSAR